MHLTLLLGLLLLPPLPASSLVSADAESGDLETLLTGVVELEKPGNALPGNLVAFGERAFVIASGGDEKTPHGVIAGAHFGRGRVIAFGHNAFLDEWDASGDGERFMVHAIRWSGAAAKSKKLRVAFLGGGESLRLRAEESFPGAKACSRFSSLGRLNAWDVVLWCGGQLDDDELAELTDFVEDGGGVLLGVCPWGNQQIWDGQGQGKSIRTDLAHNKFLRPMGLVFGEHTVGRATYRLDEAANSQLHAGRAVRAVSAWIAGDERRAERASELEPGVAAGLVADLLRALPPGDEQFGAELARQLEKSSLEDRVPSSGRETPKSDVAGYLGMLFSTQAWKDAAPEDVPAAPGSEFFPGEVPRSAKRLQRDFDIDDETTERGGWISTGLYAVAGEPLTITSKAAEGWKIRIGAHRDKLWHKDSWSRWPEITLERAIETDRNGSFTVASPFGGLVYLIPTKRARAARFTIQDAVEAPFFRLGDKDSAAEWKRRRNAPAPWAELECDGVVLTVPSGAVRKLKDPTALMEFWNRAMACYPELRGEPQPARAERLVEDIQISAGWMHSGYPVMTHGADNTKHSAAVDLETLQTKGNWGYFHEFGHNAQRPEWTFSGTGEVTCNLFSLYLGERMAGIEPWKNAWLENQKKKPAAHFEKGAPFDEWRSQPGLALMMYATVQREFGWEPIKSALRAYLDAPEAERPKTDDDKRDRWLIRLSEATGRNLGPYFEKWGVPTSAAARDEVEKFDDWMPDEYR